MARNVLDDILQSARDFDINSEESELKAAAFVDDLTGDGDETLEGEANINGFDSRPLDNAIEILRVSKSPVYQEIFGALKALHAECIEKSKNEKQSADFRNLHHVKGLGVEASLGIFTAILEESEARLKAATPAERRAMGKDANQFISDLIAPVAEPKEPIVCGPSSLDETPRVPSTKVQSNTKKAQDWLKANATRN
jgi:hypothetical protein